MLAAFAGVVKASVPVVASAWFWPLTKPGHRAGQGWRRAAIGLARAARRDGQRRRIDGQGAGVARRLGEDVVAVIRAQPGTVDRVGADIALAVAGVLKASVPVVASAWFWPLTNPVTVPVSVGVVPP